MVHPLWTVGVALRRKGGSPVGPSPAPTADSHSLERAKGPDIGRVDGARNAARERHTPCVGLWWKSAVHNVSGSGHKWARVASRTHRVGSQGAVPHRSTPGLRLACQIRPTADISIMPLLAADAGAADGTVRGGLEGSERLITVVFVDLRGSTTLGEAKMPFDVLFILNQFFHEMTKALIATNGHYSQFTGDGLMALYGLHARDPATGPGEALRGAREMLARLDQLNRRLGAELPQPLRIGIGIHFAEAIVGAMGPPHSQIITAIGDTVNTAARLEGLTKDYDCSLIVSRRAAEAAGLDLRGRKLHEVAVKGRVQKVEFYALESVC